jgi:hypothetical protein
VSRNPHEVTALRSASGLLCRRGMALDLEHELLRAARAFCAWHAHVRRDADETGFTCDDLLAFIEQTKSETAFLRISHPLVAHVVEGLAESLVRIGFFERVSAGLYTLSEKAFTQQTHEPVYLAQDQSLPEPEALPLDERTIDPRGAVEE